MQIIFIWVLISVFKAYLVLKGLIRFQSYVCNVMKQFKFSEIQTFTSKKINQHLYLLLPESGILYCIFW